MRVAERWPPQISRVHYAVVHHLPSSLFTTLHLADDSILGNCRLFWYCLFLHTRTSETRWSTIMVFRRGGLAGGSPAAPTRD